jgi:molybdopterin converting factor small subunit
MSVAEIGSIVVGVRLLPPLNNTAGRDSVKLTLATGATIERVVEALVERFDSPEFRHHLYDTDGRIIPGWCAFVNDRPVPLNRRDGPSTPISDGDEITFLLNLAGG